MLLPQLHHPTFRWRDDPQHMGGPRVKGVPLLGVELVQVVNAVQTGLTVPDAEFGNMRSDLEPG